MKYCQLKQLNIRTDHRGNSYQVECEICGIKKWVRDMSILLPCRISRPILESKQAENKDMAAEPSLVQKAANYVTSTVKHVVNGAELRTQEEIDAIFKICTECPLFNPKDVNNKDRGGKCSKCGCALNSRHSHISNKLARKNEACPDNPRRWGPGTDNP